MALGLGLMFGRRTPQARRPRASDIIKFAAPVAGWIANRALADPASIEGPGAAILDNYVPRSSSVKLRRGKVLYATLEDESLDVTALFSYRNGANRKFFGANETTVYDLTAVPAPAPFEIVTETGDLIVTQAGDWFEVSSTAGLEVLTGLTGGNWSVVQFATTGGVFLIGVNGEDTGFRYDGSAFAAPSITFGATALTTADMAFVWIYKNRLWFIEKDSLTAWYMEDADAIAGTAVAFPLAGVLGRGGELLFGQTWSLESGAEGGLSEQCIFVSTEGEVAVYQGDDPSSVATWRKAGVYRIGTPLGQRAFFRGGGDLAIATSVGLVPLSKAISLDVTALTPATVSYRIADAWNDAYEMRGATAWQCELWPEQKLALVSPPDTVGSSQPVLFISNTETGAWCRFTNWSALCMEVFEGDLYFGSPNGQVFIGNTSGEDNGDPYTGTVLPLFHDMGNPASLKIGKMARGVSRASVDLRPRLTMKVDYDETIPTRPDAVVAQSDNAWGSAIWGQSIWGQQTPTKINQSWESIGGSGYALSVAYQITSGSTVPIDDELIRLELTFTTAEIVT